MTTQPRAGVAAASLFLASLLTVSCTGGSESRAAGEQTPPREAPAAPAAAMDATKQLTSISPAIPIYSGAQFRDDLTRRDQVMIRGRYGKGAEVYTLATDDSFPQVYHFYTTYLAQFRAFPSRDRYPSQRKDWRTLEVQLNQAMQDPFIPGDTMSLAGKQVTLQIAETEAEPRTVIRYIVTPSSTPAAAQPVVVAGGQPAAASPTATPVAAVAENTGDAEEAAAPAEQ